MRKLYLLKTFLLACLFSIVGGGMAWAETETLDFSSMGLTDKQVVTSWQPASVHNISVSFQKASASTAPTYYDNGSAIRLYSNNEVTVSSPDGTTLTSIVFSFGTSDGKNTITPTNGKYDASNHKWTPTTPKNSVTFQIGSLKGKNRRLQKLTITYSTSLQPAGLSFGDPAPTVDADLYKPTEFDTPSLTNPNGLTVTYASSNEAVATVDANTGVVTLVGVGSTTITASSVKTETYAAGSASYTLNVTDSSPYFRFAKTDYSVMLITAFTAPTVETNVEGTPAYSSSEPTVATVDSETGAVALVAPGTTIITATLDAHTASYTLTVTPLSATVFAPVTAQSEVVDGGTYILLNKDGDKAMGERAIVDNKAKNYLTSETVALNSGLYTESVDGTNEPYAFTLEADGVYFRLKHGSEYLYNEKSDDTDTYWNAYDVTNADGYHWTIDIRPEKSSPIFNSDKTSPRQLGYNAQNPRFATYASSSYSAVLYRQYSASDLTLTIRDAGYATYYSDKAFVVPAGMEATTVTAANNDGTLTMAWEYQAGSIVPAATAVLLRGEAATYNAIQLTDCTVAAPTGNLLHGSTIDAKTEGGAKYYKLTYGTIDGQRKFGFFWGAANGVAFTNAAGKAYLAVPAEIAATGFRLDGMDATGIGQVEVGSQHANAAYSLSGVRVDSSKPLPAGAYIINGRKVIVK